jgi:enamine deaminase RidA (YjgF/YER057c/UK114 family)
MRRIRLAGQLAEPISHYTDGVEAGGFLYVSGMLPLDANGDLVGVGDVVRQAGTGA